CLQTKNSPWSF
nr:immunoglobulin light chain junction region [Macaca mulatta]MOV82808.1 immunoglobulin light chain junction region [Macaca mulatta]MOV84455.1 immunoglobulin light chain junction region [Macaca mulatta]